MTFNHILMVCIGNICRSPTAERLLAKRLPEKNISSAGIHALVGHAADAQASEVAKAHGLSLDGHQARQLTEELCIRNDLILVMEKGHIEEVCRICPAARSKVMLITQWDKRQDVADPYRKSEDFFIHTYQILDKATQLWQDKLTQFKHSPAR